jgi:hypothetical protein
MGVIRFYGPLFPDCAPNPINSTTLACQNGIQSWSAIINSWITVVWLQAGKEILGLLDRENILRVGTKYFFDSLPAYLALFFVVVPSIAMTIIVEVRGQH